MQGITAKQSLLKRQVELSTRLKAVELDLHKAYNQDSGEQAVERENDEVLEAIASETAKELAQIDRALSKLGTDQYGSCDQCGEPIGNERLEVLPTATTCISCAQSH